MRYGVIIEEVIKKYGDFKAVDGVSLDIKEGELFTLLGPSGCGKTTLLRMIAGFNTIEEGIIYFGEKPINQVPAHKRDIGMVFQSYAIFPHMTVAENVAYGLKAKKVAKQEIEQRVQKALKLVQIEGLKDRKPSQLSGGQQQRVALARAIVIEPGILLMDEPLSNLDAKLRIQMRSIIRKLQKELGITTIYVTHDQEEALAISDKIAVMDKGKIIQIGTPEDIYKKPKTTFVAGFIGTSNFIECDIQEKVYITENYALDVKLKTSHIKGKTQLSIRPGQIKIAKEGVEGKIVFSTFLGDYIEYEIMLETGQMIEVNQSTYESDKVYQEGEQVRLSFDPNCVRVYHPDTQEVISC